MDFFSTNDYNKPIYCKACKGKMEFVGVGEYRCEECRSIEHDDYGKVRLYIEKNRGATAAQVSEETGISQKSIRQMLKDDKIEITRGSSSFLRCEGCGANIRSGRLCAACQKDKAAAAADAPRRQNNISGHQVGGQAGHSGAKRFM